MALQNGGNLIVSNDWANSLANWTASTATTMKYLPSNYSINIQNHPYLGQNVEIATLAPTPLPKPKVTEYAWLRGRVKEITDMAPTL